MTVTARSLGSAAIAGFGNEPLARVPVQAASIGRGELDDAGVASFGGLSRLDASVGDAYNAEGYWASIAVRGFTLDNRFNILRDGLPVNAETALALDNKERIELLKGTSGVQAGTSSPGGLVNLVVKRPQATDAGTVTLQWRAAGSVLGAVDLTRRFGRDGAIGVRLNVAAETLDPLVRDTRGRRHLAALALDWQSGPDTLWQAEVERSRQRQPSVAGFSLLGDAVPDVRAIDRRLNLNGQPWRQPVVLDGDTASLRLRQRLPGDWELAAQAMRQRLKSDDRTAFPYGVYDAATYACPAWCDRFAPDGRFTYWQYVSDGERRTSDALQLAASGELRTGAVAHRVEFGVLHTRYRARFNDQVFDIAGTGRIDGTLTTPPAPGYPDANTDRDERSREWFVRDAVQLSPAWQLWLGVRHAQLQRSSVRTSPDGDGSLRPTALDRRATTPWLALSHRLAPRTTVYASWGQGLESDVAPNRARYRNAGESLLLTSRQREIGLKHGEEAVEAALTLFDIRRDQTADLGACDAVDSCVRALDGAARHRGVELQGRWTGGAWEAQAAAMWLHARREGSQQAGVNGLRPPNVPARSLRASLDRRVAAWPGLTLQAAATAEGSRTVLPYDPQLRIGGWARLDLSARWRQLLATPAGRTELTWRLGIDNATDRRAWKESPYQFGHAYLYTLPARTWRVSVQAAL